MNKIVYLIALVLFVVFFIFYVNIDDDDILTPKKSDISIQVEDTKSTRKKSNVTIEYIEDKNTTTPKLDLETSKNDTQIKVDNNSSEQYIVDDVIVGNDNVAEYINTNNLKVVPKRISPNVSMEVKTKNDNNQAVSFKIELLSNKDVVYEEGSPPKVPKYLYGIFNSVQEPFKVQIPLELNSNIVSLKVTNTNTNDTIIQNFDISDIASGDFKRIEIMEP